MANGFLTDEELQRKATLDKLQPGDPSLGRGFLPPTLPSGTTLQAAPAQSVLGAPSNAAAGLEHGMQTTGNIGNVTGPASSATGALAAGYKPNAPTTSVQDFIKNYQRTNPTSGGIAGLLAALKAAGYNDVERYMYGSTPSNNELVINGQKYKVLGAENSSNPFWYEAGTDEGNGGAGGVGGASVANGGSPYGRTALNALIGTGSNPVTPHAPYSGANVTAPGAPPTYTGSQVTAPPAYTPVTAGPGAATDITAPQINPNAGGPQSQIDLAGREAMLRALEKAQQPVDPNDPNIKIQSDVYNAERQRMATQQRGSLAERAASSGLNSGGAGSGSFNSGLNSIYESSGRDIAGHTGELVGQEVVARRQELQQALQMANAVGARDEANQIQMELARLTSETQTNALNQQGRIANQGADLGIKQLNQQGQLASGEQSLRAQLANQASGLSYAQLNSSNQLTSGDQGLRARLANQQSEYNYANLNQTGELTREQIAAENAQEAARAEQAARALDQSSSQWNDMYGLDREKFLYGMDRDSILNLLQNNSGA